MRRDTRANLIFLSIFLAVSLPGAVILFKKKMDPSVPPSFQPPAMRTSLPYLATMDAPELKRYVPERTGAWVRGVCAARGYESVLLVDGLPVVSEGRRVQLVGVKDGERRAGLLVWDEAVKGVGDVTLTAAAGSVEVRQLELLAVPEDVRKELIYAGFPKPPRQAAWVEVLMTGAVERLGVRMATGMESVPIFTK